MNEIISYLESKDVDLAPAPDGNVRMLCFFHGEEGEARTGRLYIQADPDHKAHGQFLCFSCGEKGTINKIRHHFGDGPDHSLTPQVPKLKVLAAAAQYYHEQLDDEAIEYLTVKRGLSRETIDRFKLGKADGNLRDFLLMHEYDMEDIKTTGLVWDTGRDFFDPGTLIIPYFVQGTCAQIRGKDLNAVKNKYKTPHGQEPMPFNVDVLLNSQSGIFVLTEGEFDAMILEEMGYNAIGMPGARIFKDEWARAFADCRKIFICYDNDVVGINTGREGSERVASILGGKARIVELPDPPLGEKKMDITDYFIEYGNKTEDFDLLLRKASSGQLVSVREAFETWAEREGNLELSGLKLGIAKLDIPIRPGLLPGQVVVMLARTGTGKTVTSINMMQRIIYDDPNRKILFVSLEQTRNEWFERARRIHGFYNPHLIPGRDLELSTLDFYENNLMMIDKNRLSPEDLTTNIRQAEDELDGEIDLVVVDYLGYWARAFRGEPYVRTSEAIMTLKEIAKSMNVPIFAPHQVNRGSEPGKEIKLSDARESGVIEETADFAISLLNQHSNPGIDRSGATGQVFLEFLKSRHGGVGVSAEMRFAPVSLAMVPVHDDVFGTECLDRATDELMLWKQGEFDYETVLERHRTGNRGL